MRVFPLSHTEAASRIRTPLAEFAVGAVVLLSSVFLWEAEESIGCDLETHSVFIDKLFFRISHSLHPRPGSP